MSEQKLTISVTNYSRATFAYRILNLHLFSNVIVGKLVTTQMYNLYLLTNKYMYAKYNS